jgi:hypothetical protein
MRASLRTVVCTALLLALLAPEVGASSRGTSSWGSSGSCYPSGFSTCSSWNSYGSGSTLVTILISIFNQWRNHQPWNQGGGNTGGGGPIANIGEEEPPTTVTPEPVTMTLLATGLAGVGIARRRRRQALE